MDLESIQPVRIRRGVIEIINQHDPPALAKASPQHKMSPRTIRTGDQDFALDLISCMEHIKSTFPEFRLQGKVRLFARKSDAKAQREY